jgi:hypothetical protein
MYFILHPQRDERELRSPLSVLPAPKNVLSDKRVTVVGQISPKILKLLRGELVLEHSRRFVSPIRHRNVGLIYAVRQK